VLRRIMGHPAQQIHDILLDKWLAPPHWRLKNQQNDDTPQASLQEGLS